MDGVTEAKESFEQLIETITSGKEYNNIMLFTTEPPSSANETLTTQPLFTSK